MVCNAPVPSMGRAGTALRRASRAGPPTAHSLFALANEMKFCPWVWRMNVESVTEYKSGTESVPGLMGCGCSSTIRPCPQLVVDRGALIPAPRRTTPTFTPTCVLPDFPEAGWRVRHPL